MIGLLVGLLLVSWTFRPDQGHARRSRWRVPRGAGVHPDGQHRRQRRACRPLQPGPAVSRRPFHRSCRCCPRIGDPVGDRPSHVWPGEPAPCSPLWPRPVRGRLSTSCRLLPTSSLPTHRLARSFGASSFRHRQPTQIRDDPSQEFGTGRVVVVVWAGRVAATFLTAPK